MVGLVVILNGVPRSGKSSIALALQERADGVWLNLGVDRWMASTPKRYLPGIGLRPGGERADLEPIVKLLYEALFDAIAAVSRAGINVVADLGIHDGYSSPLGIWAEAQARFEGLSVLIVGVRCPADVVMERRRQTWGSADSAMVDRWEAAVHARPELYDFELDTAVLSAEACADACADAIARRL